MAEEKEASTGSTSFTCFENIASVELRRQAPVNLFLGDLILLLQLSKTFDEVSINVDLLVNNQLCTSFTLLFHQ